MKILVGGEPCRRGCRRMRQRVAPADGGGSCPTGSVQAGVSARPAARAAQAALRGLRQGAGRTGTGQPAAV